MNYLGFLGGTNILRDIPVVRKYADAVLDGGQAAYDVLKKHNPTLRNYIQKWQIKTKFDNKKKKKNKNMIKKFQSPAGPIEYQQRMGGGVFCK